MRSTHSAHSCRKAEHGSTLYNCVSAGSLSTEAALYPLLAATAALLILWIALVLRATVIKCTAQQARECQHHRSLQAQ
jgi:hypothetical protein